MSFASDLFLSYVSRLSRLLKTSEMEIEDRAASFARQQNVQKTEFWDAIRLQFIGPNAKFYVSRFDTKGFHFTAAALWGPFWLAYRRMYRSAVLWSLWLGLLSRIAYAFLIEGGPRPITIGGVVLLVLFALPLFALATNATAHYARFVNLRLGEILLQSKSSDEALKAAYVRGRTSIAALLLIPVFVTIGWGFGAMTLNTATSFQSGLDAGAVQQAP